MKLSDLKYEMHLTTTKGWHDLTSEEQYSLREFGEEFGRWTEKLAEFMNPLVKDIMIIKVEENENN